MDNVNGFKFKDERNKKAPRLSLSPKIRYDVLRRDGFACQYCGRTGEDAVLEIDHIIPVSKGGTNDIGNLQTACRDCNRGKLTNEIIKEYSDSKPTHGFVVNGDFLLSVLPENSLKYNIKYENMDVHSFVPGNTALSWSEIAEFVETKAQQIVKIRKSESNVNG